MSTRIIYPLNAAREDPTGQGLKSRFTQLALSARPGQSFVTNSAINDVKAYFNGDPRTTRFSTDTVAFLALQAIQGGTYSDVNHEVVLQPWRRWTKTFGDASAELDTATEALQVRVNALPANSATTVQVAQFERMVLQGENDAIRTTIWTTRRMDPQGLTGQCSSICDLAVNGIEGICASIEAIVSNDMIRAGTDSNEVPQALEAVNSLIDSLVGFYKADAKLNAAVEQWVQKRCSGPVSGDDSRLTTTQAEPSADDG